MKYFELSEFDSPDAPGSGSNMDSNTLAMFDDARGIAGIIFRISSGYRTPEHNERVGGVPHSAHTLGYAADIRLDGFTQAMVVRIIAALTVAGFRRIGLAGTFVHADNDPTKPSPAYWDYSGVQAHKV